MALIKSKGTLAEQVVHNFLMGHKIKHKMHPTIKGSPDLILPDRRLAVFIHGCFWHKCSKHYVAPKSNLGYWIPKLKRNVVRDKQSKKILRKQGYKVMVVWEHEIKDKSKLKSKFLNDK